MDDDSFWATLKLLAGLILVYVAAMMGAYWLVTR